MTVRVAASAQSQALTRSAAGSLGSPRQDSGDAFDGLLSNLADDPAVGAQPSVTPDKDAGAKTPPGATALTATSDELAAAPASASMLSLATLAGSTVAAWSGPSSAGPAGAKGKTNHADAAQADTSGTGSSPTGADLLVPAAGGSPQFNLLALVQSAAAGPSSASPAEPADEPVSSGATTPTLQVPSNGTPPSGDQKSAPTDPLISDIAFQNYLAPASTAVMPLPPPVLPQAARPDTTTPLADGKPQVDASADVASGALTAPSLQALVGQQTVKSFNAAAGSASADRSRSREATIAQVEPGVSPDQDLRAGPTLRGTIAASASAQTEPSTPSDELATGHGAVISPAASASSSSGAPPVAPPALASPASASLVSAASVPTLPDAGRASGGQVAVPVIDAAIGMPATAMLPAPLQPVADAIATLATQSAGPVQASSDPASRLSPARTMLLQLNPGEMGTVSVRLHLTGRTLDVSLTASQDQTAALLDHGRDALTRAIGDQDYQVNSLVIQRGDPQRGDTTSLPGSSNATSSDYSRDQAASQGGGDASGGSSRQGADGSPARQDRSDRQPQTRAAPSTRESGLFL